MTYKKNLEQGTTVETFLFSMCTFVEIRTVVNWLKSPLSLKIKCQETNIYLKTECFQTKWDAALFWVKWKSLSSKNKSVGAN